MLGLRGLLGLALLPEIVDVWDGGRRGRLRFRQRNFPALFKFPVDGLLLTRKPFGSLLLCQTFRSWPSVWVLTLHCWLWILGGGSRADLHTTMPERDSYQRARFALQ